MTTPPSFPPPPNSYPPPPNSYPPPPTGPPPSQAKVSAWDRTKHGGKAAFDKGWSYFEKLGAPVNRITNKIGSEAFWPTTLGPECDKAARILQSFCKEGFYKEDPHASQQQSAAAAAASTDKHSHTTTGPKGKPKVLVKIPQKVIQNCVALAVFTTMRTGLWVSGAGGSGILVARLPDGSWSAPSGILIHTLGVGFMAGIDIYDCVVVINNYEALKAFSKVRVSLGGEISVVAGPLGIGGVVEAEVLKDRRPIYSYMKSRGLYGGVQADGTIIVERNDENTRFYGEKIPVAELLTGRVKILPPETRGLMEVLKHVDGRGDVDSDVIGRVEQVPVPGDMDLEKQREPTEKEKESWGAPPRYA
ncbi:hypothetical protein B7494_g7095 [Chlorociboria aeruginascens]|nr:hypothetical protein B7494_g7095 [Chlorociboria aeruginascens]